MAVTRATFNELKANYSEFLQSLKYESLSDKKNSKNTRRRIEEAFGDDGWESLVEKPLSFEEEMVAENNGYNAFCKLLGNVQRL